MLLSAVEQAVGFHAGLAADASGPGHVAAATEALRHSLETALPQIPLAAIIPWIPLLAAVFCLFCGTHRMWRAAAGPIATLGIFISFLITLAVAWRMPEDGGAAHAVLFRWIHIDGFEADFAYFLDQLTIIMLVVVTGVGSLVSTYAMGYMAGERGYARFFAGVSLFIFAMTTLVMADNLVLLYLGWEGVGLCSYLLIGYYYEKPAAVAAAKKAFIVNRIGDLGFALGIFLAWTTFGTVSLQEITSTAAGMTAAEASLAHTWIPFLLMIGAFGKSAQFPLYVWLPDAMEGPSPVSALIHAATMVTAGVYMISRLMPVFALSPMAMTTVACVGAFTAIFAATMALCQHDLKKVFAYSTISQLGFMFLGVGVASSGAVFHLFTHAFFKALLFLTAGSVMHALAGQLDIRKMSGLFPKLPVTGALMLVGCLALAGFPLTSGFFSKDLILADVMVQGVLHDQPLMTLLSVVGLFTAFLTAFYTFRVFFRVFLGPTQYEMGDEHHGDHDSHDGHGDHSQAGHTGAVKVEHHHDAHEMPWWPMNLPLVVLAAGALLCGLPLIEGWLIHGLEASTAALGVAPADHSDPAKGIHLAMKIGSAAIAILGIGLAAMFHWVNRPAADWFARQYRGVVQVMANRYWVDELYDAAIVRPLRALGDVLFIVDRLVIDGLAMFIGFVPRLIGMGARPLHRGSLQGHGLVMVIGLALMVLLMVITLNGG